MDQTNPASRKMTAQEQQQGYAICGCEKFAFVWRAELLRWMPPGYHGELCEECSTWTCSVEKLRIAEQNKQRGELPDRRFKADEPPPHTP
jgi:hypothetical protein